MRRLLNAALEREPVRRADYLDLLSDVDPDLRKEVETLLASSAENSATGRDLQLFQTSTVVRPSGACNF
jgi:hypothetical protein